MKTEKTGGILKMLLQFNVNIIIIITFTVDYDREDFQLCSTFFPAVPQQI